MNPYINKPSSAFIAASWVALLTGAVAYLIGLFNAKMLLNEKGFYFILILYGLSLVPSPFVIMVSGFRYNVGNMFMPPRVPWP